MPGQRTTYTPAFNQRPQDIVNDTANSLKLVPSKGQLVEQLKVGNTFNLPSSEFPFYRTRSDDTSITGNNSTIKGLETSHRLQVTGVRFTETVTVTATGNATFTNCKFDVQVAIAAGGRASFVGCIFVVNINNAGAVGNVGVLGGIRLGAAHTNCTVIWENP